MHISYVLIATITFPGVILHELGHKIFCHLTGVHVIKTCLFRFGNPCGYVKYVAPDRYIQSFFIAVGPLITNTACALLCYWISHKSRAQDRDSADMAWRLDRHARVSQLCRW